MISEREAVTARVVAAIRAGMTPHVVDPARLQAVLAEVVASQWAPERHYHTPVHLDEMLTEVARLQSLVDVGPAGSGPHGAGAPTGAAGRAAILAAIAWHDVVYDPRRDDNEVASARRVRADLDGLVPDDLVDRVVELVLVTADHVPRPGDRGAALLVDADLWILAAPAPRHAAYVGQVRREYAHLDEPTWRTGRGQVLRRLRRSVVDTGYRVGPMVDRADRAARALVNLDLELADLG